MILKLVITVMFVIGVIGNLLALWILHKSAKRRNPKHVFMLRCLAVNDLIAEIGMLNLSHVNKDSMLKCTLYVAFRVFGLGSGCVAFTMSLERYFAFTRPFFYQQYVTKRLLAVAIFSVWTFAALLTCMPFVGFGLFYQIVDGRTKCMRYTEATELLHVIYAYTFFLFGTALCMCILYFNVQVYRVCSRKPNRKRNKVLVRRISRNIITQCKINAGHYQTPEEIAFAKLMVIISTIFVLCWMPQMVSVPLNQLLPKSIFLEIYTKVANLCMSIYFTTDPYVYVLYRYMEKHKLRLPFVRQQSNPLPLTPNNTPTSDLVSAPSFSMQIEKDKEMQPMNAT